MIWMLARRTLGDRPRRTAMLLLGLGIAVGVMITLLSIGQAVLVQARDKDLVGGGDLVLLPAGIDVEVMKVGGSTGMYYTLDNARFLYRRVLAGPRFAGVIAPVRPAAGELPLVAASPALVDKVVYMRKLGGSEPALGGGRREVGASAGAAAVVQGIAHGFIPSLDREAGGPTAGFALQGIDWRDHDADRMWTDPPPDSLYNSMDRFHMPPPGLTESWGEWLYFNFTDLESGDFGYVSCIVSGDLGAGEGRALAVLQLKRPDEPPFRFQDESSLSPADISLERVELRLGRSSAVFRDGAYRLHLEWEDRRGPVRGDLVVRPLLDLSYPPFVIHESERFLSGYTAPALRALVSGRIMAPGVDLRLHEAPGYHDHNWGTWKNVRWEWGTASSSEHALLYGRVQHPEIAPGPAGAGIFLMLSQARRAGERGGMLALFRPERIEYTWRDAGALPGNPVQVPRTIRVLAETQATLENRAEPTDRLELHVDVREVIATPPRVEEPDPRVFLQLHGDYRVRARIDGREIVFEAPGFAEVFVPARPR